MGIKCLYANLPSLSINKRISDFANKKIGIDANAWMFQAYHSQFKSDFMQNINGIIRNLIKRIKILDNSKVDVTSLVHIRF